MSEVSHEKTLYISLRETFYRNQEFSDEKVKAMLLEIKVMLLDAEVMLLAAEVMLLHAEVMLLSRDKETKDKGHKNNKGNRFIW